MAVDKVKRFTLLFLVNKIKSFLKLNYWKCKFIILILRLSRWLFMSSHFLYISVEILNTRKRGPFTMGNKGNLGSVIFFWTLLVAIVAIATEHSPIERTKGINGLDKLIVRDRRGRSVEVLLLFWFRSIDCHVKQKLGLTLFFLRWNCILQIWFIFVWFVQVYLYGGQVTSWKNEKGEELLVMSSKVTSDSLFLLFKIIRLFLSDWLIYIYKKKIFYFLKYLWLLTK